MLQKYYGVSTILKTHAYEWCKTFKCDREVMKDLSRSGSLPKFLTEVIAKVKKIVIKNPDASLRKVVLCFTS